MKKHIKTFLLSLVFIMTASIGYGQAPPPPPGNGHGQTGNQNGGSAPVGGGLIILLGLGAVYGGKKVYNLFESNSEDISD